MKLAFEHVSTLSPSPFVSPTPLSRVRQLNNDADEQKTLAHGESDRFFPFRFQVSSGKTSPLFEIALVFVCFDIECMARRESRWPQRLVKRFVDYKIRRKSRYRSAISLPKKPQDSGNPAALIGDNPRRRRTQSKTTT